MDPILTTITGLMKTLDVIVQTRVSVLPLISKYRQLTELIKQVENMRRSQVFVTSLSVFRNQRMNTFECLNLLLKLINILGENRD